MTNEINNNITVSHVSASEAEARKAAMDAQLQAIEPFIDQAIENTATKLGCPVDFLKASYGKIRDLTNMVRTEAKALHKAATKPAAGQRVVAGQPTPKWIGKVTEAFKRAIVFAANHNVTGDVLAKCLTDAQDQLNSEAQG